MKSVTFSIPIYNNENSICDLIDEIIKLKNTQFPQIKILLIDDGSTDGSLAIAQSISAFGKDIDLVINTQNMGFGYTIKKAYTLPQSEYVFFIPGDHQFSADTFVSLYQHISKADLIIGQRKNRNDNIYRRFNSWFYNLLVSLMAKKRINDVNSIVLFKSEIINNFTFKSQSAFIHAELILESIRLKYQVKEVEIEHKERPFGKGSGGKFSVIAQTLLDFLKYIFKK